MQKFWNTNDPRLPQAKLQVADDEQRLAAAIFESVQAVIVADAHGVIERVNPAFTQLTGYSAQEVVGKTPRLLRSGHHDEAFYVAMRESIQRTGHWQGEIWDRHKSGAVFPKWMSMAAVTNAGGEVLYLIATYLDLSEQKRAQQQIHHLAFYDVLTQLPNRALLHERLQQALMASVESGDQGALLLLDLDHFKDLNDNLGHAQGDVLLQQVAQRLQASVSASTTMARLGGDEFAVVLTGLGSVREQAAARAETMGQQLLQMLHQSFVLNGIDYQTSASMGVALFEDARQDADLLLKQVEMAMYQAKSGGRDVLHFFNAALERAITERIHLERELREGISRGELVLFYQPQVLAHEGELRVIGAEALVRWQHPQRGLLPPGLFIPLAEQSNLILALGRWVMQAACDQLATWATQPGLADVVLAVNVSVPQFLQAGFAEEVLALLQRSGARPERLKLELTESLLLNQVELVITIMRTLQAQRVRFSLDDFGTGYSSLAYLQRLPLNQLKIDQSFVRDLAGQGSDAAIAHSIASAVAALAHGLGMDLIAEGVETAAQRDVLAAMNCTVWQGYFFSRPLPLQEFEAYLRAHH